MDGMISKKALVMVMNLSWLVVEKPEETISSVCGWVNVWIIIAVARLYSWMIRGYHPHSNYETRRQTGTWDQSSDTWPSPSILQRVSYN